MTDYSSLPITARLVRLRDCTLADADMLDQWNRDMDVGGFNDFGERQPVPREVLANGPLRSERNGSLIIERLPDGEPVGTIGWRLVTVYGPSPMSDALQIGVELVPSARGHGLGVEAQRLLANYMFASTSVNRVEASTDVDNVAEQRALDKAGYQREGIVRGAQFRAGAHHDLVVYARLRSDN
ncbi:MAG: GNAT family N-acetyltransferase [Candidatus Limnocylindrales bacterium]